jgi:hypothetical protein
MIMLYNHTFDKILIKSNTGNYKVNQPFAKLPIL